MSGQEKTWKELTLAAVSPKPSTDFLTGDWKTYTPVHDKEKCVSCLKCAMLCPEGAIYWKADIEKIEFNLNYCKGCGICANECPAKAISMDMPEKEE
jgi:2-oxoacid:acceptor oxidoreductase delta subunit (pyruvate/2-ketoisovalerate family)